MRLRQLALLLAAGLAGCVTSPLSRTPADSLAPVVISGYVPSNGDTITIQAVDQNTGGLVTLGHTTSSGPGITHTTSAGTTYTMYPWTFSAGVLAAHFWSPQDIVPDLTTAQGHLELVASDGGNPFATYSPGAVQAAMAAGGVPGISAGGYSDGTSTVLFDQNGTGNPVHGGWVNVAGATLTPPSGGYPPVAFSVGYYTVDGGKRIYGLICTPVSGGPYPAVIYNHGGTDYTNGGNLSGLITAAGWTDQPQKVNKPGATIPPDSLGQCLDWAKRGWVFATSSYRGAYVKIDSSNAGFASGQWQSDGGVEFCLGEVTDSLALTDLIANHAGAIAIGAAGHTVAPNVNGKLFMYGYSHGGCITWRAVEQGAPVTAVSVIEGFSDMRLNYLTGRAVGATPQAAAIVSGAFQPGDPTSVYQPDSHGVMGYNWRSAHYFASRGDLAIQRFKQMPVLILHGDNDAGNPTPFRQAALIAGDLSTTNIFVGPTGVAAPTNYPCIAGAVGAPLDPSLAAPNATCTIPFTLMDTSDPCVNDGMPFPTQCTVLPLPLASQPTQLHYMIVYHTMNHIDGGLAIKNNFNRFAEQIFDRQPGCDGLVPGCGSD